jgi:uncharacterized protein (TIGR03083 family)
MISVEGVAVGPSVLGRDYKQMQSEIQSVANKVANLVRDLPDTSVPIPNSKWTVGEAAAHIATTQGLFRDGLQGAKSPYTDGRLERFAPVNALALHEFTERRGDRLAKLIEDRTRSFLQAVPRYPETHIVHYHFGPMDLPTWLSYMLFHLLMHGSQIAIALKKPLPLEPSQVDLLIPFLKVVMPRVFDRKAAQGLTGSLEVRIRGGRRFVVEIDAEKVTVLDTPRRRVDCYLSADPVAFFLVAAGLVGQWGQIARGKLVAIGLKPSLALRLKSLFPNP